MVMPVNVPQVAVKGLEEAITSKNCIKLQLRLGESWPTPSELALCFMGGGVWEGGRGRF